MSRPEPQLTKFDLPFRTLIVSSPAPAKIVSLPRELIVSLPAPDLTRFVPLPVSITSAPEPVVTWLLLLFVLIVLLPCVSVITLFARLLRRSSVSFAAVPWTGGAKTGHGPSVSPSARCDGTAFFETVISWPLWQSVTLPY